MLSILSKVRSLQIEHQIFIPMRLGISWFFFSIQHKEVYQETITGCLVKNLSTSHIGASSELPFQDKREIQLLSCTSEVLAYISGQKTEYGFLVETMFPSTSLTA